MALPLRPVNIEVREKLESMLHPSTEAERALMGACHRHLSSADEETVRGTVRFARTLTTKDGAHSAIDAYLSHPFRVARFALELGSAPRSAAPAVIGVLHNVYEVCGLNEQRLAQKGYDGEIAHAIRLLTIDRAQENSLNYLASFYGAIEAHSTTLSLVRVVDKMDNLMGLELLEDGPVKTSYLELAIKFVGPMAERLSSELGAYFYEVARLVGARSCDRALKGKYDAFLRET